MRLNYLDLFSGIAGFRLGLQQAGIEFDKEYHSEIDKYARSIYEKHFPKSVGLGDITKIRPETLGKIDFITFGFPCQDLSIAGKRKGLQGGRSGLFYEALRLIQNLQPHTFIFENVKGLFSSEEGRDFTSVLRAIADLGIYECEWQLLNTKWFLPQNRERIYFIGHTRKGSGQKVFPITESDGKPKKKPVDDGTRITSASPMEFGWNKECGALRSRDYKDPKIVVIGELGGEWEKRHEQIRRVHGIDGIAPTIPTGTGGGVMTKIQVKAVLTPGRKEKRQDGRRMKEPGEEMFTLTGQDQHGVEICEIRKDEGLRHFKDGVCGSIRTISDGGDKVVKRGNSIRRLTPVECERLQGFPNGWTAKGKDGEDISDSQRYKCIGNAVSVPVVECIARKLFK